MRVFNRVSDQNLLQTAVERPSLSYYQAFWEIFETAPSVATQNFGASSN